MQAGYTWIVTPAGTTATESPAVYIDGLIAGELVAPPIWNRAAVRAQSRGKPVIYAPARPEAWRRKERQWTY